MLPKEKPPTENGAAEKQQAEGERTEDKPPTKHKDKRKSENKARENAKKFADEATQSQLLLATTSKLPLLWVSGLGELLNKLRARARCVACLERKEGRACALVRPRALASVCGRACGVIAPS